MDRLIPTAPPRASPWPLVVLVGFVVACFASLRGDWASLFSLESARRMAELFAGFWPLALDAPFMRKVVIGALETLAISWIGTVLAAAAGLLLAVPASGVWGKVPRATTRLVLNALRSVPELVWAALLVIAAGLGPFPGALALAVHTAGVLGRLFAEALENAPPEPAEALRRNGAGPIAAFAYATLPQIAPQVLSYSLYRWENNIRAAAILGVAGAGGLGQLLFYHLGLFHFREAGTVIAAMLLLVGLVDWASNALRERLAR
jgi:phosphonate transport system permease protein